MRWVEAGAPAGDRADAPPALASPETTSDGWMLGTPDFVVQLPEPFVVPDDAFNVNVAIDVRIPDELLPEDTWVRGWPGPRRATRSSSPKGRVTRRSPMCLHGARRPGCVFVHRRLDRELQPVLVGRSRVRSSHLAGSGPTDRRPEDGRVLTGTQRALYLCRHAEPVPRLQHLLPDRADPRPRGVRARDDPRRAHHPARRRAACRRRDPAMARRRAGVLGRRHAGGRDHEFLGAGAYARRGSFSAIGGRRSRSDCSNVSRA